MVGLTGVLGMRVAKGRIDYGRSAIGFQTMKLRSVDIVSLAAGLHRQSLVSTHLNRLCVIFLFNHDLFKEPGN
jgi:hypothetical protein